MMIKICGITTRDDARIAIDAGASAVGFNFYPRSPRYVSPAVAASIAAECPATVLKAGIFVNETPEFIAQTLREAGLDVAQLYGDAHPEGVRYWRARRVDGDFTAAALDDPAAEAYLLDTPSSMLLGGTGGSFEWSRARGLGRKIIVAGGLDASNVRQAIAAAEPWGVDACSRLESSPGRKDPARVREFIKAALSQ